MLFYCVKCWAPIPEFDPVIYDGTNMYHQGCEPNIDNKINDNNKNKRKEVNAS